jgi:hypothetical protein
MTQEPRISRCFLYVWSAMGGEACSHPYLLRVTNNSFRPVSLHISGSDFQEHAAGSCQGHKAVRLWSHLESRPADMQRSKACCILQGVLGWKHEVPPSGPRTFLVAIVRCCGHHSRVEALFYKPQVRFPMRSLEVSNKTNKQTAWSESASELYRPSDRRLSAK